jgi:hypothetical protein
MAEIVTLSSAATTPADILDTLRPDADRMRALIAVVLMEDGSWHVRHSTTQQSIVDSAAVNLLRHQLRNS